jgi:dihydrofolate reductase
MIIGIVAIAKNLAIGKDGKLPWHYSEDLKFFKRTTTGNTIVMGWNTWLSLGRPLPNRLNVVITRNGQMDDPDVKVVRTQQEVLDLAKETKGDVFIIGGSKTFESFATEIDKWLVTEVPITVEDADVFMPSDFRDGFEQTGEIELDDELVVRIYSRS